MLSQVEIDALLKASSEGEPEGASDQPTMPEEAVDSPAGKEENGAALLDDNEKDALGEIGNICMGSASTTLSELLRQKVTITSPRVVVMSQAELFESFKVPYVIIQVEFTVGLDGFNILVIKLRDAMVMASLMMGGDGEVQSEEISEIELSAASEAMNQMIGSASTSLATMFGRAINISPPHTIVLEKQDIKDFRLPIGSEVVAVSFEMKIGDLVDTEIMQVLSVETAKKEAALLWQDIIDPAEPNGEEAGYDITGSDTTVEEGDDNWLSKDIWPGENQESQAAEKLEETKAFKEPPVVDWATASSQGAAGTRGRPTVSDGFKFSGLSPAEQKKLELLLEVPLKVSVVLGRTRRPIREVLNLTPGAIVELNSLVDEPVEVLVNGTLVAKGEVVVVNENFGIRISNIVSPEERLRKLKE
ncbi:MAG: flagellar motor switch phosphatase FliY [Peptococcaceae bacterium]|nr:flagellar motor switch phosphatase FliY [Peptococcaceae bacterium]